MWQAVKMLGAWVGCVIALEGFFFAVEFGLAGAGRRVTLSKAWRVTTGTVVAVDRSNHNSITVRYTIENRPIEQTFTRSEKGVGDGVDVYYSPNDWSLADIENPTLSLRRDLRFISLTGLVLGTFACVVINFRAIGSALAWPWSKVRLRPRLAMTWIAIAVAVGIVSSLLSVPTRGQLWLAHGLAISGAGLLCVQAFRVAADISWSRFARSPAVIVGVLLVVIGQLIMWAGQNR